MRVQYSDDFEEAFFDGNHFARDKRTGYYLSSRAINGRRKRLHVCVWEYFNGDIPAGYHIHHVDRNKFHNDIDNLSMMTKEEHEKYHANNMSEEQLSKMRESLLMNAVPASVEWHGTEEGRSWHSDHAKKEWESIEYKTYFCTYCGDEFKSRKFYGPQENRFCSNNCKAAYRRRSGVDDVLLVCKVCGGEFYANKYTRTTRCKVCGHRKNRV